jgi:hypothetical protein
MQAREYTPAPGENAKSDLQHLVGDLSRDFNRLTGTQRTQAEQQLYKNSPVLMSVVRDDGMRCCYKCPCKCLSTFVCFECCQDGAHVYAGEVPDQPKKEVGRPFDLPAHNLIGSVKQPIFGGVYRPTLHLRSDGQNDEAEPFGKIQGPCCFGGWSELCCDFKFTTSWFGSEASSADIALITKKKPTSLAGGVRQMFSNADVYQIAFNDDAVLTPAQKLTVLSAQLLADYMFFDNNTEKCRDTGETVYCYCFYCSIIGAPVRCTLCIPKKQCCDCCCC